MVTRHTFFLTKRIAFRLLIYSTMSLDDLSYSFTLRWGTCKSIRILRLCFSSVKLMFKMKTLCYNAAEEVIFPLGLFTAFLNSNFTHFTMPFLSNYEVPLSYFKYFLIYFLSNPFWFLRQSSGRPILLLLKTFSPKMRHSRTIASSE